MSGARGFAIGLGWLVALSLACAGLPAEELPADPIAVTHWEREAFRKRDEILSGSYAPGAPKREGIANVDDLHKWLGAVSGAEATRELARYPGHLSLLDPRTGKLTRVAAAPAGSRALAWSPDHRRLLFATAASGSRHYQIREYDLDSGEVRAVTYGRETHVAGDYGPEDRIVFGGVDLEAEKPSGRIYTAGPRGQLPRVLLDGVMAETVRWSPLGDTLMFVVRQRVRPNSRATRPLLVRQATETDESPTSLGPGQHPSFTPDGEWIVYSAPFGKQWKLRRMRLDGSGRAPVGNSIRSEEFPAVSPDGRFVAYVAREGELDRMFVRRIDGSGDRVLPGDGRMPFRCGESQRRRAARRIRAESQAD